MCPAKISATGLLCQYSIVCLCACVCAYVLVGAVRNLLHAINLMQNDYAIKIKWKNI